MKLLEVKVWLILPSLLLSPQSPPVSSIVLYIKGRINLQLWQLCYFIFNRTLSFFQGQGRKTVHIAQLRNRAVLMHCPCWGRSGTLIFSPNHWNSPHDPAGCPSFPSGLTVILSWRHWKESFAEELGGYPGNLLACCSLDHGFSPHWQKDWLLMAWAGKVPFSRKQVENWQVFWALKHCPLFFTAVLQSAQSQRLPRLEHTWGFTWLKSPVLLLLSHPHST